MKKILLIDQYNAIGGGQNILIRIAKILSENFLISFWGPMNGDLYERLKKIKNIQFIKGVAWDKASNRKSYFSNYLQTFINTIQTVYFLFRKKELVPDLIFANGGKIYPQAIFLGLFLGKPVILAMHLIYNQLMQKFLFFQVKNFQKIYLLFVSNSVAKIFNRINHIDHNDEIYKKIFIQENSLSEDESKIYFDSVRFQHNGVSPGKKSIKSTKRLHVAVVGRIHPEKGQDILFEIIDNDLFKDWRFTLIGSYSFGEDRYFNTLKERLSDRVNFFGEARDVPKILKKLKVHVVIMPSRVAESFGLIAIEAMASSCLTIVSDKGELPFIAHKTGAFVFKNRKEFLDTMCKISKFDLPELKVRARKMHDLTQKVYPFFEYRNKLLNIINSLA